MPKSLCRLCMSTESLQDIHAIDGCTSLSAEIMSCINIEIYPNDCLPTAICRPCKKKLRKFYKFKQKCLKVDSLLRSVTNFSQNVEEDNKNEPKPNMETSNPDCNYDDDLDNSKDFYPSKMLIIMRNSENEIFKVETTQINENNAILEEKVNDVYNGIQCEVCGCIFDTKAIFKKHLTTHSETAKFHQCKMCSKRFTRAENKTYHMRSHLGIRPFICEICGQSTTKRQDLLRHMKIHSNEKKHACPNCDRKFKRPTDLHSHIRTHSGTRPYKCRHCHKDYTSHGGLRKHYKTHCKDPSKNLSEIT